MFKSTHRNNRKGLLATLVACSLLAACGGEDDGGDKSSGNSTGSSGNSGSSAGGAAVCLAYLLVSGNDECLGYGTSSSSLGGFSAGSQYILNTEVEPNNDWPNSNNLYIQHTTSPDGVIVDGDVNDVSDVADTFSFSRHTGRNFRFKLCSPDQFQCNEFGEIDTLTAYIDILDSNGNVIASSQADTRNFVSTRIDAGLTYYIRIAAGDTMASTVTYQLMGQEFE